MTIDIEVREMPSRIPQLGEEAERLPYIPAANAASISTLQSVSQ
ncbi:hypothetical protein [Bradyrhizobium viridifuturi]|nr:hypothetical protein [Bradyrhizobium viridifuturi]